MSSSIDASRTGEAARFLARFSPFQELEPSQLDDIAEHAELRSFASGAEILLQGADPADHLFVLHRGVVELIDEGHVVDQLRQGELFGISVFSGLAPALSVRAREDVDCYLIDPGRARALMGTPPGLASLASHMTRWHEQGAAEQHMRRAGVDDHLLSQIGGARDVHALGEAARHLPASVAALLEHGVDPVDIGHVVGMAVDHLTKRSIDLFIDERGEPPVPFAWVALGSAARHEQALTTDQDHAMAYGSGSDPEEIGPYFAALAAAVTDALEACGIQRCRGNVMAVNPAWRRTREGWRQRFGDYIAEPDLMGARITGIAFDYRRVTGAVDIEATLDEVIRAAGHDRGFVRRLATTALEASPPVGRRRDIEVTHRGEHAGRIDIKHDGITIVTNLARVYAIMAGVTENRTTERLRSAASAGVIPDGTRDGLLEAFHVLWGIRLARHADLMGHGEVADDFVDPTDLPTITERALGGSLRVITEAQEHLARELGLPHHRR
jgi:signal-transduction protein with cAMP-binding, CBS, and nucleotidyltransferase domain